jgi:hypothetical protein
MVMVPGALCSDPEIFFPKLLSAPLPESRVPVSFADSSMRGLILRVPAKPGWLRPSPLSRMAFLHPDIFLQRL